MSPLSPQRPLPAQRLQSQENGGIICSDEVSEGDVVFTPDTNRGNVANAFEFVRAQFWKTALKLGSVNVSKLIESRVRVAVVEPRPLFPLPALESLCGTCV